MKIHSPNHHRAHHHSAGAHTIAATAASSTTTVSNSDSTRKTRARRMDEDEDMRIAPFPPLAPSLSSAYTEPIAAQPQSRTSSNPSSLIANPATTHHYQSSTSVPTSSTFTLSSLAHAASASGSTPASASISAASSTNVSPTLAHKYPFSASADNLSSLLNSDYRVPSIPSGDVMKPKKKTSQVSSLSAALSSIAQEELLELERKEAERRREYEFMHAELERRAGRRMDGASSSSANARLSRSANASPDSTPLFPSYRRPLAPPPPPASHAHSHHPADEYDEYHRFERGSSRPSSEYYDRQHHSVYCDGDSMVDARGQPHGERFAGGLVPRLPSCHHDECHKSYRTLLKMSRHQNLHSSASVPDVVGHVHSAAAGGGSGHSKTSHRHHPYEPSGSSGSHIHHHSYHSSHPHSHPPASSSTIGSGTSHRKPSPPDTTPSPISEEGTRLLPPLLPLSASSTASYGALASNTNADEYAYYTPSTSPFLHAVRNMNMGRSRTSSRVPSRAPSPVPLHLPPSVVAASNNAFIEHSGTSGASGSTGTATSAANTLSPTFGSGRADRHHRSHRSHPSLYSSPLDGGFGPSTGGLLHGHSGSEHRMHRTSGHPYPHSHGGTPPGTPAPLTMMSRRKKAANATANSGTTGSKYAIDSLLASPRERPAPLHLPPLLSAHSSTMTTPALSTSTSHSSPESAKYRPAGVAVNEEDELMEEDQEDDPVDDALEEEEDGTTLHSGRFPPPPNRSRPSSEQDVMSPVRLSPMGSYDGLGGFHSAMMAKKQKQQQQASSSLTIPPLIPGIPASTSPPLSSATLSGSSTGGGERMSGASSPTTPVSALNHSNLAHSVRIAFGMTPIHPPNYFSSRGRSTLGFGSSSVRGTVVGGSMGNHPNGGSVSGSGSGSSLSDGGRSEAAASVRSSSPPIVLPPLKISLDESGARSPEEGSVTATSTTTTTTKAGAKTVLPHLDELAGRLGELVKDKSSHQQRLRQENDEREDGMELE
ncbi:hypothetical protein FRC17_010865 [Serendipita sp. 399]|nr:hypothetical protein FRC17_010865 [Serendipita sp. 399]